MSNLPEGLTGTPAPDSRVTNVGARRSNSAFDRLTPPVTQNLEHVVSPGVRRANKNPIVNTDGIEPTAGFIPLAFGHNSAPEGSNQGNLRQNIDDIRRKKSIFDRDYVENNSEREESQQDPRNEVDTDEWFRKENQNLKEEYLRRKAMNKSHIRTLDYEESSGRSTTPPPSARRSQSHHSYYEGPIPRLRPRPPMDMRIPSYLEEFDSYDSTYNDNRSFYTGDSRVRSNHSPERA